MSYIQCYEIAHSHAVCSISNTTDDIFLKLLVLFNRVRIGHMTPQVALDVVLLGCDLSVGVPIKSFHNTRYRARCGQEVDISSSGLKL